MRRPWERADRSPDGSLQRTLATVKGNPLGLIVLVGRSRVEVELGRLGGILRAEQHLLVDIFVLGDMAATNVQRLLGREGIFLAIDNDDAVALTTVDDTYLAIVEEILVLDSWVNVEAQLAEVLQFQRFSDWHSATKDKAVVVGIGEVDLVGHHHLLHDEALTKGLGVVVLHVFWMTGSLEVHLLLGEVIGDATRKQ